MPIKKSLGFSMIEVLITLIVCAGGIVALTALQTNLMRETGFSKQRAEALEFSNGELNKLAALTYPQIAVNTVEAGQTFCPSNLAITGTNANFTLNCTVTTRDPVTGAVSVAATGTLKVVTITTQWNPAGSANAESLVVSTIFSE